MTQVLVDKDDPALHKPNKPIGSFMSKEQAEEHRGKDGWDLVEDAGRGWRRVVASPRPKAILELDAVRSLPDAGFVVVAAGGGGIAVVPDEKGDLTGVAAVVDKDLASSLLAHQLKAETPGHLHRGGESLPELRQARSEGALHHDRGGGQAVHPGRPLQAREHAAQGPGGGGVPGRGRAREAFITDPAHLAAALTGKAGTRVVP